MTKRDTWPILDQMATNGHTKDPAYGQEYRERKAGAKTRRMDKKAWYNQPEFVKERDKWYKKAAKSGFQDLEVPIPRTGCVSDLFNEANITSQIRYHCSPVEYFGKLAYWDLMRDYYAAVSELGILLPYQEKALELLCLEGATIAEASKAAKCTPNYVKRLRKGAEKYIEGRLSGEQRESIDWVCSWCGAGGHRSEEAASGSEDGVG